MTRRGEALTEKPVNRVACVNVNASPPTMKMIHWLYESIQNMTEPPEVFLSAAELEKFRAFRFEKRRSDWLLGRWTAKRLLQAVILQHTQQMVLRNALEIHNDADGVPVASFNLQPLTWNLSISHSNAYAVCAVCDSRIGADLESIAPREPYLVNDYFTANEQARVNASPRAQREIVVTAIWSAKEAALKAIHKGLSLDTRAVEISIASFEHAPARWTAFEIKFNFENAETYYGWWRVQEGFVLTLATDAQAAPYDFPTSPEISLLANLGEAHGQGHGDVSHRIAGATRHHARHESRD